MRDPGVLRNGVPDDAYQRRRTELLRLQPAGKPQPGAGADRVRGVHRQCVGVHAEQHVLRRPPRGGLHRADGVFGVRLVRGQVLLLAVLGTELRQGRDRRLWLQRLRCGGGGDPSWN